MARPAKNSEVDFERRHSLTVGLLERLRCPDGKSQALLRDSEAPSLRVRVTSAGSKSFVFEGKLDRENIRRTIGNVKDWTIEAARAEARRLAVMVDSGVDPREADRQAQAAKTAALAQQVTVGEVWAEYLRIGKPLKRDAWKPRYRADLERAVAPGGVAKVRGKGLTRPGPLYALMDMPLDAIDEDRLSLWYEAEAAVSAHQAARALMMFRGFLRWCSARPAYKGIVDREAGKAPMIIESLPRASRRTDALEPTQVKAWWTAAAELANPTASVYLRGLLLTGARREELAGLTWQNVDFKWGKMTIADKVESTRTIPMGPYLRDMIQSLPRVNEFVFASTSKSGRLVDARSSHERVLAAAGITGLTLHGLRRSFSLLGEAAGAPAGALAQIMGHKPSATAERYRPRSIDGLRPFMESVENSMLVLAGVVVTATGRKKASKGAG